MERKWTCHRKKLESNLQLSDCKSTTLQLSHSQLSESEFSILSSFRCCVLDVFFAVFLVIIFLLVVCPVNFFLFSFHCSNWVSYINGYFSNYITFFRLSFIWSLSSRSVVAWKVMIIVSHSNFLDFPLGFLPRLPVSAGLLRWQRILYIINSSTTCCLWKILRVHVLLYPSQLSQKYTTPNSLNINRCEP